MMSCHSWLKARPKDVVNVVTLGQEAIMWSIVAITSIPKVSSHRISRASVHVKTMALIVIGLVV